eukprot:TRINITY_DN108694_c0_g1_i1.p1 TRINITY_DN108694_c0_g1~~TRINITY_DN108694_c0_g1_i1.p1  ORF type:complete len:495 (-),score=64.52 TRINITY_DN108694_c0_g1_i1:86-1570(-)
MAAVSSVALPLPSSLLRRYRNLRILLSVATSIWLVRAWRIGGRHLRRSLVAWVALEGVWRTFMRQVLIPRRVQALKSKDAGSCKPDAFFRTIDLAESSCRNDPRKFWRRITRIASSGRIPRETVKGYAKNLLYMRPGDSVTASKASLLEAATDRLEAASPSGFETSSKVKLQRRSSTTISGWTDDEELCRLICTTPLAVCAAAEISVAAVSVVLAAAGWVRACDHGGSGLEMWMCKPRASTHTPELKPLVLLPGLGCGFASFLPLALVLQRHLQGRTLVLFRWPWSEWGMPLERMPQWDVLLDSMLEVLSGLGYSAGDVVAHSYGTIVANRLLRRLCDLDADEGCPKPTHGFQSVGALVLLEPMVFGDSAAGMSCGLCNHLVPDLNTATLANRGGVPWKESMFYDPMQHGQCLQGISVHACTGDALLDIPLTRSFCEKHVPSAKFKLDETWGSFHGRFLLELFCTGTFWSLAPCARSCLHCVLRAIEGAEEPMR